MEKEIFEVEQQHLTKIYNKLLDMKEHLEGEIANLDEKASDEKNDIRDNIRLDYADDETTMETLGEIEVWNRYIDTYNIESKSLGKRLQTVKKLLEAPYFAKITVQFDPSEEPEDYYIGRAAISENGYDQMVIDWRTPIAEVYYNQENGQTHYTVEDREIPVDLKLRRQFELEKNKLNAYFDTSVAIEDPMLLQSLSQAKSDKMTAITATIQKEQNEVIRYPEVPVLLVNGIAGSGKTSVLLQRIAYLFYQRRQTLRPDQVCLMTLNPVFREYIDNVLPDLGETNPITLTWKEFLETVHVPFVDSEFDHTDSSTLEMIHDKLPMLEPQLDDFYDIYQKENLVLSKKEVFSVIKQFSQFPFGVRLIQTVADELDNRAKNSLKIKDSNFSDDTSSSLARSDEKEENKLENDFGGALKNIRRCGFVNVTHIAQRLLNRPNISAAEWFFLKMELTGECDRNMRYVMVDEVQDYTKAQLMVLKKYFPNVRFMLLGDEFQAIRSDTVSFSQIKEMAKEDGKRFVELFLMTSYRSSPEITDLFASILPGEKKMMISSVRRPGEKTYVQSFADEKEYKDKLISLLKTYKEKEGLTALICRNQRNMDAVLNLLGEEAPTVISGYSALPKSGAFMLELTLAKGLEFDHVIIADADDNTYPDDELGHHCLYTAMSRATSHLNVLAKGNLSKAIKVNE